MTASDEWLTEVRGELDRSTDKFDGATLSTLNQARHQALARYCAKRKPRFTGLPLSYAGAAATAGLALVLWLAYPSAKPPELFDDLEIIAATVDPDFYRDLDFFNMLAADSDRDNEAG